MISTQSNLSEGIKQFSKARDAMLLQMLQGVLYLILYRLDATEMGEKSSTCKVSSTVNIVLSVFTLQID